MFDKLLRSFDTLYKLLEHPEAARRAVTGLLAIHTCLLAYSAYVHSPTLNEPGHLVAGLSHWEFGRFDVYRVNPPLVKMIAALPVMSVGYEEDWSALYDGPGARPEMAMGEDFVTANGERSIFLFTISRWACIPFSWIGAITCFLWARDLYGRPSGLMACAIWCFEPNILAHASLITPDIGGTALGVAACYTFWKWLKKPTWGQAALTGVVLGLAELCKTTLILFYPLWPLLWLIYRWRDRAKMAIRDWVSEAGMLALRMAIGLYILNLGYGFEGTGTKLMNFQFVSDLFAGRELRVINQRPDPAMPLHLQSGVSWDPSKSSTSDPTNRFATSWLGALPVPLPKNYVLGIDIQQKDFEHYGKPSYLRGEWRDHGWWYYYLYAALIKVPLGLWSLGFLALATNTLKNTTSIHVKISNQHYIMDSLVLLTPPLVIFTTASVKIGISEHFRYILPCFPFLFIWLSQTASLLQVEKWVVKP